MRKISTIIFVIILCFLFPASFSQGADSDGLAKSLLPQKASPMAPDFNLKDLTGKSVSLKDYRGRTVLLDFTTTWCPYCKYDIPKLKKLYEARKGKDFELLAVYINESQKKVSSFATQYSLPYPVLLDTDASVARNYGIMGVPTKIMVRKDGTISCWQCTEEKINEILNGK